MATTRPTSAFADPRHFGRRPALRAELPSTRAAASGDDLRLFAITFAAGFLFVSVLIG